jgi:hypothetical protein
LFQPFEELTSWAAGYFAAALFDVSALRMTLPAVLDSIFPG